MTGTADVDRLAALAGLPSARVAEVLDDVRAVLAAVATVEVPPARTPPLPRPLPDLCDAPRQAWTMPPAVQVPPDRLDAVLRERMGPLTAVARAHGVSRGGPLAGLAVAVKGNLAVAGWPHDADAACLDGHRARRDADAVARLRAAGACVVARTGMDALAMGVQTDTGVHGAVGHPADPGLVPGGSSGGSAVAVARGLFDVALGSDTGGSVRLPAALCGVVGLRPTWGRVSRDGLVPLASSMDTVGVLAREVGTVATVLQVLAGPSPRDATARARPLPWGRRAVTGLRVGLPRAWWSTDLDPRVREAASDAVAALRAAGALPVAMDVAGLDGAGAVYAAWVAVEAASDLARYDGRRLGTARGDVETVRGRVFGDEAVRRVVVGHALTDPSWSATWARARQARAALGACLATALADVHVLLGPASASPAWRRGQRTGPLQHATTDRLLAPASLAGLPAVSVPAGTASGLPVGVQVVGRAWDEATVLSVAAALEDALR